MPQTPQSVTTLVFAKDDQLGPARQSPPEEAEKHFHPVSKPIQEEKKVPEHYTQLTDSNQATNETMLRILTNQKEVETQLRQELKEMRQDMNQERQEIRQAAMQERQEMRQEIMQERQEMRQERQDIKQDIKQDI